MGDGGQVVTMFVRSGTVCVARFGPAEAAVLNEVMLEVVTLLSEGFDRTDPVIERLFPDVYRDDPSASADLRRYTEDDLRSAKLEQAAMLLDALPVEGGEVALDEEQAEAWLRALTDVRLTLGLRLGIIDDDVDIEAELDEAILKDPTSQRVGQLSVYQYLTYLQESLVGALMG
ncbi:DUF2017 domain-containing protein [Dactylosporangium fulvum]|uniref:DUF2017 domain-containing protein n=1 Tax=Dactylosporangium fulvum TaxID=53359 RepID=A0ABY5WDL1_9ACTN|nr:DUF2017 domain-containing protein [Dactylosporangium fulvum]UWP87680.1 DUF2017 domain-containing protein [Dactylosporangium fulvum]